MTLSEGSQIEKGTYCVILVFWNSRIGRTLVTETDEWLPGGWGLEEGINDKVVETVCILW